jgi:hypothetical protein
MKAINECKIEIHAIQDEVLAIGIKKEITLHFVQFNPRLVVENISRNRVLMIYRHASRLRDR